jgi:hypothetical protein
VSSKALKDLCVRVPAAEEPIGVVGQGEADAIVLDIGGGHYVVLEHLQQGSALVRASPSVTRGTADRRRRQHR